MCEFIITAKVYVEDFIDEDGELFTGYVYEDALVKVTKFRSGCSAYISGTNDMNYDWEPPEIEFDVDFVLKDLNKEEYIEQVYSDTKFVNEVINNYLSYYD